jgi:hypothetical protein
MTDCEIYYVRQNGSFVWKWRHVEPDGRVKESQQVYSLYYECVSAARTEGYKPAVKCS